MATGVAAILCIDDELDVHDTCTAALTAARERRTEASRVGLAFGELEHGDPVAVAWQLCKLARPGAILLSGGAHTALDPELPRVELGLVSFSSYRERWSAYELDGETERERTFVAVDLTRHAVYGHERAVSLDEQADAYDSLLFGNARAYGGFVQEVREWAYSIAFDDSAAGIRAACAIVEQWYARPPRDRFGNIRVGVDHDKTRYFGERWWGSPSGIATRLAGISGYQRIAITTDVRDRLPADIAPRFEAANREELRLKGVEEPLEIFIADFGP